MAACGSTYSKRWAEAMADVTVGNTTSRRVLGSEAPVGDKSPKSKERDQKQTTAVCRGMT